MVRIVDSSKIKKLTINDLERINKLKPEQVELLLGFIAQAIQLSEKSQINAFYNANWHLPNLVHHTFSEDTIESINKLNLQPDSDF